ncbi:signal peptidase II [Cephaloticoccus primus]|uniref:Lipoprotein signal peptidase n=1 Tax=Cephaloticoccus primus TaxID=1548207 RepID=A0A139SMW1_9BACT|nr:signal peptidase II [Cephaloticoccus primus]KXU35927.1 signal peptidase II [Cephaloticoccus primus]
MPAGQHAPSRKVGSPPPPPLHSRWQRISAYRLLLVLAVGTFALDQATKWWIIAQMPLGSYGPDYSIAIIPGFFHLVHVGNTGAAWSILSGKSTLLAGVALVSLGAIYFFRLSLGLRARRAQLAFGLLCGGIVGNLVDRLQHGHVIDFLDFHFGSYIYPTFNVADSAICIGVILYLWHSLNTEARSDGRP